MAFTKLYAIGFTPKLMAITLTQLTAFLAVVRGRLGDRRSG